MKPQLHGLLKVIDQLCPPTFTVLQPGTVGRTEFTACRYCTPTAMRTITCVLYDVSFDPEVLSRDDDGKMRAFTAMAKIVTTAINGIACAQRDGFALAKMWDELYGSKKPSAELPAPVAENQQACG